MISLRNVQRNFDMRAYYFRALVDEASLLPIGKRRDALLAHVAIELQTAVGYVARNAFLAGMLGGWTYSGQRLRPQRSLTAAEALADAAKAVGRKSTRQVPGRDEPAWHSIDHLRRVLVGVPPANHGQLVASLAVYPEARRAVLAVRNFYAHRGQHTYGVVEKVLWAEYAEVLTDHPSIDLLRLPDGKPYFFLERWIWNYVDAVHVMCGP